jgi:hypothetical protein
VLQRIPYRITARPRCRFARTLTSQIPLEALFREAVELRVGEFGRVRCLSDLA